MSILSLSKAQASIYIQATLLQISVEPRFLSFHRALQAVPNGTHFLLVPESTTLRLPQLEATLNIYYNTAAVLIIFGNSFVSNLKLKCAICTGYELISKSRWMNVLYLNKLFVEYKTWL